MDTLHKKMFLWCILNIDYFIWLYSKNFSFVNVYKNVSYLLLALFFPFLSYFDIDKLLNLEGEIYIIPITLKQDTSNLTRSMQSKLFWYYILREHKISTPTIYYYKYKNKNYKINDTENDIFISKPEYGTEGVGVKKINNYDFLKINHTSPLLLQEYVKDCFVKNARHFRIITVFDKICYLFSLDERKQHNRKIASNHANGATIKMCKENCDFLSEIENDQIKYITNELIALHKKKFNTIPLIGWDVCLTCNGPYVFEGNLGSAIPDEKKKEYMKLIKKIYSNKSYVF